MLPKTLYSSQAIIPLVAIGGIAAAIAVPNFQRARRKAKKRACVSNMKTIEGATELFRMEHSVDTPVNLKKLVQNGYIKKMPRCPSGGKYSVEIGKNKTYIKCTTHGDIDGSYGL